MCSCVIQPTLPKNKTDAHYCFKSSNADEHLHLLNQKFLTKGKSDVQLCLLNQSCQRVILMRTCLYQTKVTKELGRCTLAFTMVKDMFCVIFCKLLSYITDLFWCDNSKSL